MKPTLLLITQVYVPDPAAVGQYMADAAEAMAARGWRVIVYTANRGYDNPKEEFPSYEVINGVEVQRLPYSSLGKATILHRLAGQISFCVQAFFRGLFVRDLKRVLVTTSPPMGAVVAWAIRLFRKVSMKFWVMDINPDQAIALGMASEKSLEVKIFDWFNRECLRQSDKVIVLDRFMGDTMARKEPAIRDRTVVIPTWPLEGVLERIEHDANPFRKEHGLEGKFVIMYSGNHSLAHPLDTLVEAARRMEDDDRVVFMFIGGGKGKQAIDKLIAEKKPKNIRSLPYQPLDKIKYSLSAADVHVVTMGNEMVGIVHPCKFYGAMALSKPVFCLGPRACHVADVLENYDCGWTIAHGEVEATEALLRRMPDMPASELDAKGHNARRAIDQYFSKAHLGTLFCEAIEQ